MPTYAILGATGQTGSELVKLLLPFEDNTLHLYARSRDRLVSQQPLLNDAKNARLFIGDLGDAQNLDACLEGVDAVFSAVAQNSNEPGCDIAQRTAQALVASFERSEGKSERCPRLVFLSSGAVDPRSTQPWLLHQANYYVYRDLEIAVAYLRERPWIPLAVANPGGLVHAPSVDVELTLEPLGAPGGGSSMCPYPDLARGMVMMSEEEKWIDQEVGIGLIMQGPVPATAGLALIRFACFSLCDRAAY